MYMYVTIDVESGFLVEKAQCVCVSRPSVWGGIVPYKIHAGHWKATGHFSGYFIWLILYAKSGSSREVQAEHPLPGPPTVHFFTWNFRKGARLPSSGQL